MLQKIWTKICGEIVLKLYCIQDNHFYYHFQVDARWKSWQPWCCSGTSQPLHSSGIWNRVASHLCTGICYICHIWLPERDSIRSTSYCSRHSSHHASYCWGEYRNERGLVKLLVFIWLARAGSLSSWPVVLTSCFPIAIPLPYIQHRKLLCKLCHIQSRHSH